MNLTNYNLIEFFSRHAVIFALMGNVGCAEHLGKQISNNGDSNTYRYYYHDNQEAEVYWMFLPKVGGAEGLQKSGGLGCLIGIIILIIFVVFIL